MKTGGTIAAGHGDASINGDGAVVELIVERWTNLNQTTDFRWSVWVDGKRVQMGGPHKSAEESEREGKGYCTRALSRQPDRVTRL
jgi:hypothetical protein